MNDGSGARCYAVPGCQTRQGGDEGVQELTATRTGVVVSSGKYPRWVVDGDGDLEREGGHGEAESDEIETKTAKWRYLRLIRVTANLTGASATRIGAPEQRLWGGGGELRQANRGKGRGEGSAWVFIGGRLWRGRKGIEALVESVTCLAGETAAVACRSGGRHQRGRERKETRGRRKGKGTAALTCGARLQREGETTCAGG